MEMDVQEGREIVENILEDGSASLEDLLRLSAEFQNAIFSSELCNLLGFMSKDTLKSVIKNGLACKKASLTKMTIEEGCLTLARIITEDSKDRATVSEVVRLHNAWREENFRINLLKAFDAEQCEKGIGGIIENAFKLTQLHG